MVFECLAIWCTLSVVVQTLLVWGSLLAALSGSRSGTPRSEVPFFSFRTGLQRVASSRDPVTSCARVWAVDDTITWIFAFRSMIVSPLGSEMILDCFVTELHKHITCQPHTRKLCTSVRNCIIARGGCRCGSTILVSCSVRMSPIRGHWMTRNMEEHVLMTGKDAQLNPAAVARSLFALGVMIQGTRNSDSFERRGLRLWCLSQCSRARRFGR